MLPQPHRFHARFFAKNAGEVDFSARAQHSSSLLLPTRILPSRTLWFHPSPRSRLPLCVHPGGSAPAGAGICSLAAVGVTAVRHLQSQRGGEGSRASLFTELSLTQCKQNAGVTAVTCAKVYGLGTSHSRGGDHTRVSTWSGNSTKGKDRGAGGCSQRLWRTGDTHLAEGGRRSSKMPLRGTHFI